MRNDDGLFPELFDFLCVASGQDEFKFAPLPPTDSDVARCAGVWLTKMASQWEADSHWPKSQRSEWQSGVGHGLPVLARLYFTVVLAENAMQQALEEKAKASEVPFEISHCRMLGALLSAPCQTSAQHSS